MNTGCQELALYRMPAAQPKLAGHISNPSSEPAKGVLGGSRFTDGETESLGHLLLAVHPGGGVGALSGCSSALGERGPLEPAGSCHLSQPHLSQKRKAPFICALPRLEDKRVLHTGLSL